MEIKRQWSIQNHDIFSLDAFKDLLKKIIEDETAPKELVDGVVNDIVCGIVETKLREFGREDLANQVSAIDKKNTTDSELIDNLVSIVCNSSINYKVDPFDYIEVVGNPSIDSNNSYTCAVLNVKIKKIGENIKITIKYASSEEFRNLDLSRYQLGQVVPVKSDFFQNPSEKVMFQIGERTYTATSSSKDLSLTANGVNFKMIHVEAGSFQMGSDLDPDNPIHSVELTQDYYIGETVVTQALWRAVMNNNPSYSKGDDLPVEDVAYYDPDEKDYSAKVFINRLNNLLQSQLPQGYYFDLPTEAQWEYAARGGRYSQGKTYSGSDNIYEVAWYFHNSRNKIHPVKEAGKKANELGIYGMSGNVWEWCRDWYDEDYCKTSARDPLGPSSGSDRVLRGGGWSYSADYCRVAYRRCSGPGSRCTSYGFRLALVHQ